MAIPFKGRLKPSRKCPRTKRHTVSYEARFSLSRSYGLQASPFSPSGRMRRTTNARRGAVDRLVEPPGLTPQFDRPRAPLPQEKTNGFQSPSDLHHDVHARLRNLLKRIGQQKSQALGLGMSPHKADPNYGFEIAPQVARMGWRRTSPGQKAVWASREVPQGSVETFPKLNARGPAVACGNFAMRSSAAADRWTGGVTLLCADVTPP